MHLGLYRAAWPAGMRAAPPACLPLSGPHSRQLPHCPLQSWLTDADVSEVLAQYDTNGDGVIR